MNGTPRLDSRPNARPGPPRSHPPLASIAPALSTGEDTWLDPYAASDPAEFFAVLTEAFFELPAELAVEYPAVYACLRAYYRVDPKTWSA